MQSIEAVRSDWRSERRAALEQSHRRLQSWGCAYPLPVPCEVNGATDAQRADAYRAATRACLRLIFEGMALGRPGARGWPERVWALIQQYGVGRARDLEGSPIQSSEYETALYDIVDWYRDLAARILTRDERLGRASATQTRFGSDLSSRPPQLFGKSWGIGILK
jgi:hypothetical protein